MIRKFLTAAALTLAVAAPAVAEPLARDVFSAIPGPTGGAPIAIGNYSNGCVAGAVQMPESGPTWQLMRLSRNRVWGHPELVDFLVGLSQAARQAGWRGLYIGDLSQPRGGPMKSSHASHQIGLDADIWLIPPATLSLSRAEREQISALSVVNKAGTAPSALWSPAHMAILRAAARDPRIERIFIDPVAKVAMCKAATGDRSWLRKIRPLGNHADHIHVRLKCPSGSACAPQNPIPPGDGCDEAAQWIEDRIHPKPVPPNPNYRHPRSLLMSELPQQCRAVAAAR